MGCNKILKIAITIYHNHLCFDEQLDNITSHKQRNLYFVVHLLNSEFSSAWTSFLENF